MRERHYTTEFTRRGFYEGKGAIKRGKGSGKRPLGTGAAGKERDRQEVGRAPLKEKHGE